MASLISDLVRIRPHAARLTGFVLAGLLAVGCGSTDGSARSVQPTDTTAKSASTGGAGGSGEGTDAARPKAISECPAANEIAEELPAITQTAPYDGAREQGFKLGCVYVGEGKGTALAFFVSDYGDDASRNFDALVNQLTSGDSEWERFDRTETDLVAADIGEPLDPAYLDGLPEGSRLGGYMVAVRNGPIVCATPLFGALAHSSDADTLQTDTADAIHRVIRRICGLKE